MIQVSKIHPVSEFVRHYRTFLDRIAATKEPEVLTVNGKAACVLVDAESYAELVAAYEKQRFVDAVKEGLASMSEGSGVPVSQGFRDIRDDLRL